MELKDKKCANPECGNSFTPKRSDSTTCSKVCYQRAFYLKSNPGAEKAAPKKVAAAAVEKVFKKAKIDRVLAAEIPSVEPGPLAKVIDLHMRIQALESELAELEDENPDLMKNAKAVLERIAGGR